MTNGSLNSAQWRRHSGPAEAMLVAGAAWRSLSGPGSQARVRRSISVFVIVESR